MSTLEIDAHELRIEKVEISNAELRVTLRDGRTIATPLRWYPKLLQASPDQLANYEIMPMGIHWPDLDEDLSVVGMLAGQTSTEYSAGFQEEVQNEFELEVGADGGKISVVGEGAARMSNAIADLLSPLTEGAGLVGDRIRLYREKVARETLIRAHEIAHERGIKLEPVPPKFLIPWLEKASLEEVDSPLIEWWANLLVSATDPNFEESPYFADVISKLTGREAKLLERIWRSRPVSKNDEMNASHFIESSLRSEFDQLVNETIDKQRLHVNDAWMDIYEIDLDKAVELYQRRWEERGILFRSIRLDLRAENISIPSDLKQGDWISLDLCKALNLLSDIYFEFDPPAISLADKTYSVHCTWLTSLGIEFMAATHRES